jgi:NTE family protein
MRTRLRHAGLVTLCILISACAHYPVNTHNDHFNKDTGYRFDALEKGPLNTDTLFVCLMFSGGGTRAAALSYGIMQALRDTRIQVDGEEKSLLDEVDCISSVSGGSFTSAYYGLFRERLFSDFRSRFLERNIQGDLAARLFNPINWVRLASPYFGRTDMAAEFYDAEIFDAATFAGLEQNGRPLVILNATNLGSERRFDFSQEHFDAIGSRLDQYKVSRAVAASSAFPFLLSAISLKNYPTAEGYELPWAYKKVLDGKDQTSRSYDAARNLSFYLNKQNAYVHLMDGGLSDNIGARAILDAYDHGFIRTRINDGAIEKLVFIVVNARTESADRLSQKESPPGIITVASKTGTVAMDNYSYESVARLREILYGRVQVQKDSDACDRLLKEHCPNPPGQFPLAGNIDPYVIEINFRAVEHIPDENPQYYLNLPTSFKLSSEQVAKLIAIGPKLLHTSPMYQCLLEVLRAEANDTPRPAQCPVGAGIIGSTGSDGP